MTRKLFVAFVVAALSVYATATGAQEPTEIVRAAWDHWRGESSYSEMTMVIHRPSWERAMSMRAWTRGSKHEAPHAPPQAKTGAQL